MPLTLLSETKDYVVAVKPCGVDSEHAMPEMLAAQLGGVPSDFFCVHRLDQAAGGLLVYARHAAAAAELSREVQDGTLEKHYLAVISGCPAEACGTYRDFLYRDRKKQRMYPVKRMRKGVKEAILTYEVLGTMPAHPGHDTPLSLVRIRLLTGRYHQIRVQFASRGMPLVGDGRYGSRVKAPSLALLSSALSFRDPDTKEAVRFTLSPPDGFPWNRFSKNQRFRQAPEASN